MRGNESVRVACVAVDRRRFSIPMRGNEWRCRGVSAYLGSMFSIPMRGNEAAGKRGVHLRADVFDPHEG